MSEMQEIVINVCYGSFRLSDKACEKLNALSPYAYIDENLRTDQQLIKVVKELGEEASGQCADLRVIKIPSGIKYRIFDYDGVEFVVEEGHYFGIKEYYGENATRKG